MNINMNMNINNVVSCPVCGVQLTLDRFRTAVPFWGANYLEFDW